MLKSVEDISKTKKRLKIEIPSDVIESEIRKVLLEKQKKVRMPGFRPGKTPIALIEKKFGKEIELEVLDKLTLDFYLDAIREANLKPVSNPMVEDTIEFQRGNPLSMTVTVEVMPKLDDVKYENITVREVPFEVTEEDIDAFLKRLIEEKASYETVNEVISSGDIVSIDYKVKEEGLEKEDVVLKIGTGPYPQEFFDAFIGKRKDDEFSVEASFPENQDTIFAGKRLNFEIKIKDVKKRILPSLDDEFAKDLGFDDMASLRNHIRESLFSLKKSDADKVKQREIVEHLLRTYDFEIPETLLDSEISGMIKEIRSKNKGEARPDEELKKELEEKAKKNIRISYLLDLIGEKEGITVSEEEIKEQIINIAQSYRVSPKDVIDFFIAKDGSLEGIRKSIFDRKVLNLLLEKSKLEDVKQ